MKNRRLFVIFAVLLVSVFLLVAAGVAMAEDGEGGDRATLEQRVKVGGQPEPLVCNGTPVAFEADIPSDWTVVDNTGGTGIFWTTTANSDFCFINNLTNGSGEAACADSDAAGSGAPPYDTELVSNAFDLTGGFNQITLNVAAYYNDLEAGNDVFEIDIWNGAVWTNLLTWDSDHTPEDITLDLSAYAGMTGLQIRFVYSGDGWDWYAEVDDVALTCAIVAAPPDIVVDPTSLETTLFPDNQATLPLNISNIGEEDLTWTISEALPAEPMALPTMSSGADGGNPMRLGTPTISPEAAQKAMQDLPLVDVIQDGGFETGTPNAFWNEFSSNFGTPLCDAGCGLGGGTGPHGGAWWAWFGGTTAAETGYVDQDVTIPVGVATLSFWLEIPAAGTPGFMNVEIDDDILFTVTEADAGSYDPYALVTLDVSAYADGGVHNVEFYSETSAGQAVTNFFVDDVVLDVVEGGPCTAPLDIPWLSLAPTAGTTISGTTDTVDATFDSTGLLTGVYTGTLCINSNDPDEPLVQVPVTLTVTPFVAVPGIVLTKTVGLDANSCATTDSVIIPAGFGGTEVTYCYTVQNTGDVTFTNHTLTDTMLGTLLNNEPVTLGPGATYFITQTSLITETTVNTAYWTAYDAAGAPTTASDTATVTQANPTDVNISRFDGVQPMALAPVWLAGLLALVMGLALALRRKFQS